MSELQNDKVNVNGAPKAATWRALPQLDLYENAGQFLVLLDVPGATVDSIDVQIVGTELYVRAERAASTHQDDVARIAFERRLELPAEVDANSAVAELRDGVLEVRIQKSASARRVKIPVTAS